MIKKTLNQNVKMVQEILDTIEPDFIFSEKPTNRFKFNENNIVTESKNKQLSNLKLLINSIENCKLKENSKNLLLGDGDINSKVMLVGETPGEKEELSGLTFQGEAGDLLDKMLLAINVRRDKIYCSYSINFRPPEDRKPTNQEIKRYVPFLKDHISIINPKIIICMGATAMQAITGLTTKISDERGKWKEIIFNNNTVQLLITFSPSYLLRFPENKKFSWEDLKKIRQKIHDQKIKI